MPTSPHIIILGCGRSGTSIFGELFEHLPGYTYLSEPPFTQLTKLDYASPVAVKAPKESAGFPPTLGLSFPLDTLLATVPEPRAIYWQVRHPLDTICSLRVGIAQDWGHHPRPPNWKSWLHRPLLERCAHHWNFINLLGYEAVAHLATITRFEAMVANPRSFAKNVVRRLGLDPDEYSSAIAAWAQRVQNTNNRHFVEAETSRAYSRADHRVKVERWKENLSEENVVRVLPIVEATAEQRGYALPNSGTNQT